MTTKLRKTAIPFAASITLASALAACSSPAGEASSGDEFRIVGTGPLTGPASSYGISNQQGAELAVEDVNESGDLPFELTLEFEDDKCDAAGAASAYRKIVAATPDIIYGGACSPSAIVIADNAERDKRVFLNTAATADVLVDPPRTYVFSTQISASDEAQQLVELLAAEYSPETVGFAYSANDYGQGAVDAAKEIYAEDFPDVEITADVSFPLGTTNFRSGLVKVKEANPDVVLVVGSGADPGEMVRQAKDLGVTSQFAGYAGLFSVASVRAAGDALADVTGTFYTPNAIRSDSDNAEIASFAKRYKEKYGEFPDQLAVQGYHGILVLTEALKDLGRTPEDQDELVEALESVKDFEDGYYPAVTFGPDDRVGTEEMVLIRLLPGREEKTSVWGEFEIINPRESE
ncbi:MAG: ABC transporter substrate-binding protein [Actinomycetota bacterium]